MAKYWENLKYHEDTVVKEKLSNDDIKFLKELQKELNTEDNVGTATPRYWVIRQPERIYHIDRDAADYYMFVDDDYQELTLEELKNYLEDVYDDNLKSVDIKDGVLTFEYLNEFSEEIERYTIDFNNLPLESSYSVDKVLELLELEVDVVYYKEVDATVDNCMFLTQIDAENHLRANDYHYHEEARTYCMCGWRSPRFERLINILSKTDFDSMLEKN